MVAAALHAPASTAQRWFDAFDAMRAAPMGQLVVIGADRDAFDALVRWCEAHGIARVETATGSVEVPREESHTPMVVVYPTTEVAK